MRQLQGIYWSLVIRYIQNEQVRSCSNMQTVTDTCQRGNGGKNKRAKPGEAPVLTRAVMPGRIRLCPWSYYVRSA